jgi:hypothetical protein
MKKQCALFIMLILILVTGEIFSLPRFAVKLGDRCIDCHYNPTGGIIRNLDGWHWGKNILSMISTKDADFSMSPKISDNISIGIDYRTQFLYSQEKNRTDFQKMSGSMYTNLGLSKRINVIGKYDFVNLIWEGYGVAQILPGNGYIKAGAFTPNFGIRIDDHTAFTRGGNFGLLFTQQIYQGLIYNPFYTEAGLEVGIFGGDFLFATASVGSNLFSNRTLSKDPTYTARIELTQSHKDLNFLFGGSFAAAKIPQPTEMYGGFLGFGYDELSLLAEFDFANDVLLSDQKSNFLMVEAAYGLITGLDVIFRYDRMDINTELADDELSRLIAGFEFQPYAFIEIRPQYRFVFDAANPNTKNDAFVLQFHFWY